MLSFLCFSSLFFLPNLRGRAKKKNKIPKEKKNTGSVSQTTWPTNDTPNSLCWAQSFSCLFFTKQWYSSLVFTPYWALLLGVPLSFALRLAQHLGVLSTVALAGGYRQVAGGRWYWSHESGATQVEINIHLSMMSALSIYTVLMRTNSPKQPGCLQLI